MLSARRATRLAGLVLSIIAPACITYRPQPLDPGVQASALEHRTLSDDGLQRYVAACEGAPPAAWPPETWSFARLTKAALFFSPDLARADAEVAAAEADAFAAGLRPDPSLLVSIEQRLNNHQGTPATTWGPTLDVPITTWGKRGIRQAEAGARVRESQFRRVHTAWQVRSALRSAVLAWHDADDRVAAAQALSDARERALALWQARLAAGDAARGEVQLAEAEAHAAGLALAAARQARAESRAALARALGVPESAMEGVRIAGFGPDLPASPDPSETRTEALTRRSDLLAGLAAYAASDQALRLAIRSQYPDLILSPGYLWDQGADAWVLGVASVLPLVNRARGEIARAEAARTLQGKRFLALQEQVLHDIDAARSSYDAALATLPSAQAQERARRAALEATVKAVAAGEDDALSVAAARANLATATLDVLSARRIAEDALGRLEDALERPIAPSQPLPPLPAPAGDEKENAP